MKFLPSYSSGLPFLGMNISAVNQSVLLEATFWTILYIFFVNSFSVFLRSVYKPLPLWKLSKKRSGTFCFNAQDDTILLSIFVVHHGTAAAMMIYGHFKSNPAIFRHGYLWEMGFELGDTLAYILNWYPFRHEGMRPSMTLALMCHHIAGILLLGTVIDASLYYNPHLRALAIWLLVSACGASGLGVYSYSLNLQTQLMMAVVGSYLATIWYYYLRLYLFLKESLYLIGDIASSDGELDKAKNSLALIYLYVAAVTFFNLVLATEWIPTTISATMRLIDGKTSLESKAVHLSREDRQSKRS